MRVCLDCVIGGLDLSCLTGSVEDDSVARRVEVDRCRPLLGVGLVMLLVVGLLMFNREGSGRIEVLLIVLPVELGGLVAVVVREGGFTGSLLGD